MDGDPTVEPSLDSFSLFLPLPFRVAVIIVLGTPLLYQTITIVLISNRSVGMGR